MPDANNARSHAYNWGIIIPVVLALISATWAVARAFMQVETDLANINSGIRSITTNVAKLQVAVGPTAAKTEAQTIADIRSQLEDLRDQLDATQTVGDDPLIPAGLREYCDDESTTSPSGVELILVGEARDGRLLETDQQLDDGTYFDEWLLPVCESGTITVEMTSEVLDSYLLLLPVSQHGEIGQDDDSGDGLDARLTVTVDPGFYIIGANTSGLFGTRTGDYTLSVDR